MVESSKILTVSYGTFSCTLEGFDDSFSTMKAIAEYFRDLAAGDRYFGAEPPAPDAEMLTKIAEREISRRVEARSDANGITLKAGDALGAAAPVAFAPQTEDTQMPPVALRPQEAPDMDVTQANAAAIATDETTEVAFTDTSVSDVAVDDEMDVDGDQGVTFADMSRPLDDGDAGENDSVADKLMRIRAVVGTGADEDGYIEDLSPQTNIEDAFEEDEAEVAAQAEAEAAAQAEAEAEAAAQAEAEAEAAAQAEAEAEAAAQAEAEAEAAAQAEAEAEATTLVEEKAETEAAAEETQPVAEPSVPKPTIRARILRLARPTFGADTSSDADIDNAPQQTNGVESDNMITNIAAKVAVKQKEAETQTDAEAPFQLSAENAPSDDAEVSATEPTTADRIAALNLGGLDQDTDDTAEADEAPLELTAEDAIVETPEQSEDNTDHLADMDLRVDVAEDAAPIGSLSDEDEADLQKELADVAAVEDEQTPDQARSGRDILPDTDDAALTRIMGQADEQLSEPEGNRRRNAIAQLKAAVAATEAARQLGDNSDEKAVQENAFREDFKEVVRPTPASAVPRTEVRRERPRPTPLKLVDAQRVDNEGETENAANVAPVSPRRVAATTAHATDAGNFAEFAEEMGASELPDLLEAAAAYIAYVEGVEDFSRPQIIQKVQATTEQEFSREDGLRSFGTLLRQGRISKVRNGRFQVSDQTRFKPDQKAG